MAKPFRQPYLKVMSKASASLLPKTFRDWFESRGWEPRAHQLDLLAKARAGRSVLLVAPDGRRQDPGRLPAEPRGAGRAGAEPGHAKDRRGLSHPLHLAPEGARRPTSPATSRRRSREMGLPIRIETRTGDTPSAQARAADRAAAGHPADHAGAAGAAAGASRRRGSSSRTCGGWCWTSCTPSSPRSAATSCRSAWRGC